MIYESPSKLQLFARNSISDSAYVTFAFSADTAFYEKFELKTYRNQILIDSIRVDLNKYADSVVLTSSIKAELSNYKFQLTLITKNGSDSLILLADSVVAGDAYLICGQSNAAGRSFSGSANAEFYNPYCRTYGFRGGRFVHATNIKNDSSWYVSSGDGPFYGSGLIGQWALTMASQLIDTLKVPIAIISNSTPGKAINHFYRNDPNPQDLATNYGQILFKSSKAALRKHVKAIFFYQGESDSVNVLSFASKFDTIYNSWKSDYPAIEKIYTFQVNEGCGNPPLTLREVQRTLPNNYHDVIALSTTNLPGHDTCHYNYIGGYREIGLRCSSVVAHSLYRLGDGKNAYSLDPRLIYLSKEDSSELTILFSRKSEQINATLGAEKDFIFSDTTYKVSRLVAEADRLRMELNKPFVPGLKLSYNGHRGNSPGWVYNSGNAGMFAFYNLDIEYYSNAYNLDSIPMPKQFLSKPLFGNSRDYKLEGEVFSEGIDSLVLVVTKNGQLVERRSLLNSPGPYSETIFLTATNDYHGAKLLAHDAQRQFVLGETDSLVVGIGIGILGDINAAAPIGTYMLDTLNNGFIWTYGSRTAEGMTTDDWGLAIAEGNLNNDRNIGAVALRLARTISDSISMPIAVFSQIDSASQLKQFLKNNSQPLDTSGNYGRFLSRLHKSQTTDCIKTVILYHGEYDSSSTSAYYSEAKSILDNLKSNFPLSKKLYLVQTNLGCGISNNQVREAQRLLVKDLHFLKGISTIANKAYDGCTYSYINGYEEIAEDLAKSVLQDIFNVKHGKQTSPQHISEAWLSSIKKDQLNIRFSNPADTVRFVQNPENYLHIGNGKAKIKSFRYVDDFIRLDLDTSLVGPLTVSYIGQMVNEKSWLSSDSGDGIFAFNEFPISNPFDSLNFSNLPHSYQFIPRIGLNQIFDIEIIGRVVNNRFESASYDLYKNGVLDRSGTASIPIKGINNGLFHFPEELKVELSAYSLKVFVHDSEPHLVYNCDSFLIGDVFLVNGGLNAVATQTVLSADSVDGNYYIQTYGGVFTDSLKNLNNFTWNRAKGDQGAVGKSGIGQLALSFASEIVSHEKIPIAILNQADNSLLTEHFLENSGPFSSYNNYTSLRDRITNSGSDGKIKSLIFYPPEIDTFSGTQYFNSLNNYISESSRNYKWEKFYLIQNRKGCEKAKAELAHTQAEVTNLHKEVRLILSNGINGHDSCTYNYYSGYKILGKNIANAIISDIYKSTINESENLRINRIYSNNLFATKITIELIDTNNIIVADSISIKDFYFEGDSNISIFGLSSFKNNIFIQTDSSTLHSSGLSYFGHSGSNSHWIKDNEGNFLTSFYNKAIDRYTSINAQLKDDFSILTSENSLLITGDGIEQLQSIHIYNLQGALIQSSKARGNNTFTMNFNSELANGIYFAQLIFIDTTIAHKFIIRK